MLKYNLFLLLLFGCLSGLPNKTNASPLNFSTSSLPSLSLEINRPTLSGSYQTASVCFLPDSNCNGNAGFNSGEDYDNDPGILCEKEGYTKQNCSVLQEVSDLCPYDSAYGRGCKCRGDLVSCPAAQKGVGESCGGKYQSCQCSPSLVSCASNQVGSGGYCGGKYESCECKSEFLYSSSNCSYPRSVSGSSCGGKYNGCSCPTGINAGSFGCAEYYPAPCSSVCKTAKSDNCNSRTNANAPYGCMTYWSDCSTKCQTPYPDNCRSRDPISIPSNAECSGYFGDCGSKCSSWKCQTNFINWCTPPETNCSVLGYNKTTSQCSSGYVKCPYGSAVYCAE